MPLYHITQLHPLDQMTCGLRVVLERRTFIFRTALSDLLRVLVGRGFIGFAMAGLWCHYSTRLVELWRY
jgi:hypothetical protein